MTLKDKFRILLLTAISFFLIGCMHAATPFLPQDWKHSRVQPESLEDNREHGRLQVLIMYIGHSCAHTTLRLSAPDRGTLFWDPAGGYGIKGSAKAHRKRDLIIDKAPSLNEYLVFRTEIPTTATEIFEWRLSAERSNELYDTLLSCSDNHFSSEKFTTQGMAFYCGSVVADFLNNFAHDIVAVEKTFFPHDLSKKLYNQSPYRVIIARDGNINQYLPPGIVPAP